MDGTVPPTRHLEALPFETDDGIGYRARLGAIVLSSDYTVEHEYRMVLDHLPGVALYVSRIQNDPEITPESLAAMRARIAPTAATLLPGDRVDSIAYGCTSASMVIGPEEVAAEVHRSKPDVPVTNPISAAVSAFRHFGARRIGVLTPYTRDVNEGILAFLQRAGFEVPVFGSFNEPLDPVVCRISAGSIAAALERIAGEAPVDMLFVSCTSVRLLDQVGALETTLGVPVTSSNQALIWQSLRLAGIDDALPGLGRLLQG